MVVAASEAPVHLPVRQWPLWRADAQRDGVELGSH